MHKPLLRVARALAAAAICCNPVSGWTADQAAPIRQAVDAAILPLMAKYDVPGMAIAVTVDGQTHILNYGVASRESNTPVGEATLFEIGSVSKTITATLASYAKAINKLSLEDHPGKYLPQLAGAPLNKANLLHLGTYTAGGLPLQFPESIADNSQVIGYFSQWKPEAAPGTQRRYSNPSIGLLGHITALALQTDFADAVETQLFTPLGMGHSFVRVPESAMGQYAWGYNKANQPVRMNPGAFAEAAYGVRSTAADMLRFVQANMVPGRSDEALQRAIEGTHLGYFQVGAMVQGLGWEQYAYPVTLSRLLAGNSEAIIWDANRAKRLKSPRKPGAAVLFNKTGSTGGFGAYIAFVPERKIGVVMLANRNYPIPARIGAAYAILGKLDAMKK